MSRSDGISAGIQKLRQRISLAKVSSTLLIHVSLFQPTVKADRRKIEKKVAFYKVANSTSDS